MLHHVTAVIQYNVDFSIFIENRREQLLVVLATDKNFYPLRFMLLTLWIYIYPNYFCPFSKI